MNSLNDSVAVVTGASLHAMVERAESAFGPIGILVSNAGVSIGLKLQSFTEISEDEFDHVMRVNVRGVFQSTKAVVPSMRRNGAGGIINIDSGTINRRAPLFAH